MPVSVPVRVLRNVHLGLGGPPWPPWAYAEAEARAAAATVPADHSSLVHRRVWRRVGAAAPLPLLHCPAVPPCLAPTGRGGPLGLQPPSRLGTLHTRGSPQSGQRLRLLAGPPRLRSRFASSLPQGSHTGMSLNMLRVAGRLLDFLFVMSYDAGDKQSPPGAPTGYDAKARPAVARQLAAAALAPSQGHASLSDVIRRFIHRRYTHRRWTGCSPGLCTPNCPHLPFAHAGGNPRILHLLPLQPGACRHASASRGVHPLMTHGQCCIAVRLASLLPYCPPRATPPTPNCPWALPAQCMHLQSWGQARMTLPEANDLGSWVAHRGAGGLMLWSLTKPVSAQNGPDACTAHAHGRMRAKQSPCLSAGEPAQEGGPVLTSCRPVRVSACRGPPRRCSWRRRPAAG